MAKKLLQYIVKCKELLLGLRINRKHIYTCQFISNINKILKFVEWSISVVPPNNNNNNLLY